MITLFEDKSDKNEKVDKPTYFFLLLPNVWLKWWFAVWFAAHLYMPLTPTRRLPRFWRLFLARCHRQPPLAKVIGSTSNPIDCLAIKCTTPCYFLSSTSVVWKSSHIFRKFYSGNNRQFRSWLRSFGFSKGWPLTWHTILSCTMEIEYCYFDNNSL